MACLTDKFLQKVVSPADFRFQVTELVSQCSTAFFKPSDSCFRLAFFVLTLWRILRQFITVIVFSACHKVPFYRLRDVLGCLPCFAMAARAQRRARSISSSSSFRPQGRSLEVPPPPPDGATGTFIMPTNRATA